MGDKIVKSKNLCCQPVVFPSLSLLSVCLFESLIGRTYYFKLECDESDKIILCPKMIHKDVCTSKFNPIKKYIICMSLENINLHLK